MSNIMSNIMSNMINNIIINILLIQTKRARVIWGLNPYKEI